MTRAFWFAFQSIHAVCTFPIDTEELGNIRNPNDIRNVSKTNILATDTEIFGTSNWRGLICNIPTQHVHQS